jgi:hypothetical protein
MSLKMIGHWRTRLDPNYAARFGCSEVHAACFQHLEDRGGLGTCIAIQVPETPRALFNGALHRARRSKARIVVVGDTAEQVRQAAARIERGCRHNRRVSYERAEAAAWGPIT